MIKIIKSNRKTVSLNVSSSGEVFLKVPFFVSKKFIDDFLNKHKNWLLKKQIQALSNKSIKFLEGDGILFLGKKYELTFNDNIDKKLLFDGNSFVIKQQYKDFAKDLFIDFYKKQSLLYFRKKVDFFAKKYNLVYNNIRISGAKGKWGSCNSKKNLNFVYNLILADEEVIDYVIIHELAHTKHMNHSKVFWEEVKFMMPNYLEYKTWLKKNGQMLRF